MCKQTSGMILVTGATGGVGSMAVGMLARGGYDVVASTGKPDQAGWRRRCTSCGGMHFPRTDPVVIMLITHGNAVLLGRSPGWPEGMYSLLAGFVEPGESLEAAVRRQVEVGMSLNHPNLRLPYPAADDDDRGG